MPDRKIAVSASSHAPAIARPKNWFQNDQVGSLTWSQNDQKAIFASSLCAYAIYATPGRAKRSHAQARLKDSREMGKATKHQGMDRWYIVSAWRPRWGTGRAGRRGFEGPPRCHLGPIALALLPHQSQGKAGVCVTCDPSRANIAGCAGVRTYCCTTAGREGSLRRLDG